MAPAEVLEQRQLLSSVTPSYLVPTAAGVSFTSIMTTPSGTTGDSVGSYVMAGTPDGLGAFDNGNGTFTLLINHEFALANSPTAANEGVAHTHNASLGAAGGGSYIDRLVIRKSDLSVISGGDQILAVFDGATGQQIPAGSHLLNFSRFCSADLPDLSAFYNAATGNGTTARIFLNGEETLSAADPALTNVVGRAMAHIVTGDNNGDSYTLPVFGRHSWENLLANPDSGDTTLVIGNEDNSLTNSKIIVYVGTKQSGAGLNDIQKAGLTNGTAYDLKNNGDGTFSLVTAGTGSNFPRPEDGAWDPNSPNDYYFTTTATATTNSQLWHVHFTDRTNPQAGGTIEVVLNGQGVARMFDNMTINKTGQIVLQEDVGNNARLGKVWMYDLTSHALVELAQHDPALFSNAYVPGSNSLPTQDEESSGVIDVSSILGEGTYLLTVQAHYPNANPALVEGGQLLLMRTGPVVGLGYDAATITATTPATPNALVVLGTSRNDRMAVTQNGNTFDVSIGSEFQATRTGVVNSGFRIIAAGYAGNDTIDLSGTQVDASVYGGHGNDRLFGSSGMNYLNGGKGNDLLDVTASALVSVLEGGPGNDQFVVGDNDILVDFTPGTDVRRKKK